ncbi:MAG: thioredoxin domain-containing protein [Glutamicibacter arilaitensis]|uniref:thioredoxin domain-containing protein n=1 Tax=Glutamicibacter arilaitensis TaxID=256701 RepID=UPI003FD0A299
MAQRLAGSSSQYLRQHSHQLVDWFPYGDEAFEQARLRDVPVMLSIGYAACHWCHVMSHESFDDPEIAALLNENFVAIKVDREEHPLVDDTYMLATQALTGAGGWPMTIFTLPDGRTVHAGTYYPKEPRGKTPSFSQVLNAVHEAWETKRSGLEEQAQMLAEHLAELGSRQSALLSLQSQQPADQAFSTALDRWIAAGKPEGGFTPAPKFPPTWALKTLSRAVITEPQRAEEAFEAAATHLEAIFLGGLQDHVDGGFARYCVDANWSVPHFEKMLYDNAGLLSLAARTSVLAAEMALKGQGDTAQRAQKLAGLAQRSAQGIITFLEEELLTNSSSTPALAASLDADSSRDGHQVEGAYYTLNREEIAQVTDPLIQRLPKGLLRFAPVAEDPQNFCFSLLRTPEASELEVLQELREQMRTLRRSRIMPIRDEKVIAGWNGLAIEALCEAALLLEAPDALKLAAQAAESVWQMQWDQQNRRLARVSFAGAATHANEGTLQDYSALALGFLALHQATGQQQWAQRAKDLLGRAADFVDPESGVPRDTVQSDARITAQRSNIAAVTVLDDATPASGALYAKALAVQALQSMAAGEYTDADAAALESARGLSAHALALASEAPTQVATALEVQCIISSPVHYLAISQWDSDQAKRVRSVAMSLGINVRHDPSLPHADQGLQIQPCREELCQLPVLGIEGLFSLFSAPKNA